jgi:hypothetical protein
VVAPQDGRINGDCRFVGTVATSRIVARGSCQLGLTAPQILAKPNAAIGDDSGNELSRTGGENRRSFSQRSWSLLRAGSLTGVSPVTRDAIRSIASGVLRRGAITNLPRSQVSAMPAAVALSASPPTAGASCGV